MRTPLAARVRGQLLPAPGLARFIAVLLASPILLLLALAFAAAHAPSTHALSCAVNAVERFVEQSDVVLVGTIAGFEPSQLGPPGKGYGMGYGQEAHVTVKRYLKGSGPESVSLRSTMIVWAGGWREEHIGQRWVFFLNEEDDALVERLCMGSGPVDVPYGVSLADVEAITGPSIPPEPTDEYPEDAQQQDEGISLTSATTLSWWAWGAGVSALLSGLGGAALAFVTRR